jgi:hypothetical protein
VTSNVKASFMSLIPFVVVVTPCDLWLVITYASTIMFYNNIHHMYICVGRNV